MIGDIDINADPSGVTDTTGEPGRPPLQLRRCSVIQRQNLAKSLFGVSLAIAKRCAKTLICAWVACELVGCADGRPEKGDTIQKFADRIRDRSYGGLDWVQASVAVYCRYAGGVLTVEVDRAAVQDDLICMVGLTPLWGFQDARHVGNTYSTYVLMPTLLTADQVAANEHVKWEASFGERRLSADKLREEADEASRQQALAAERLEQFRRNCEPGTALNGECREGTT